MQQREMYPISKGPSECFLIFDREALGFNTTFFQYLESEGFVPAYPNHGDGGSKHCYVNITRKQYAYGKGGVQLGMPIGNASITVEEFKLIWGIYRKHLEKGECFDHRDEPFIYQSETVINHRRKYEENQRLMEEMQKNRVPATPVEVEALVNEFPYDERMIRGLAAKGETASVIRGIVEFDW